MVVTYTNPVFDRLLTGIKRILDTEFGQALRVYVSEKYKDQRGERAIRLNPGEITPVSRLVKRVVNRYPIEVSVYVTPSQKHRRGKEYVTDLVSRIIQILEDNAHYTYGSAYQWHDGRIESLDYNPDREEGEPEESIIIRMTYTCTVAETRAV